MDVELAYRKVRVKADGEPVADPPLEMDTVLTGNVIEE